MLDELRYKIAADWRLRGGLRHTPPISMSVLWCPTLCDLRNCSPPGACVHGISQARILEWVDISFFRGSSHLRNHLLYWQEGSDTEPPGKPALGVTSSTCGCVGAHSSVPSNLMLPAIGISYEGNCTWCL